LLAKLVAFEPKMAWTPPDFKKELHHLNLKKQWVSESSRIEKWVSTSPK